MLLLALCSHAGSQPDAVWFADVAEQLDHYFFKATGAILKIEDGNIYLSLDARDGTQNDCMYIYL